MKIKNQMREEWKTYHLKMPRELHEALLRVFPYPGERARFFREMAQRAIESHSMKGKFYEAIIEKVRDS